MKVRILSPWKQEKRLKELEDDYLKRIKGYASVDVEEIKGVKGEDREARGREGKKILSHIKERPFIVTLIADGQSFDSVGFSRWIENLADKGRSDITFIIGGSTGLDETVIHKSDFKLSLSPMTFPHRLARVMLIEQVYRAFTLIKGESYHK